MYGAVQTETHLVLSRSSKRTERASLDLPTGRINNAVARHIPSGSPLLFDPKYRYLWLQNHILHAASSFTLAYRLIVVL